jgi:hypothetical protein
MAAETYAYFLLTGLELDPEEVTKKVGITPTKTFLKGDRIHSKGSRAHPVSGWQLRSKLDQSSDLEDHIQSVLDQLKVSWQPLLELCSQYDTAINCVMYHYTSDSDPGSGIHFDQAVLDQIHQLNAELDFDLYILPERQVEAPSFSKDLDERLLEPAENY